MYLHIVLQSWILASEVVQETDTCSSGPLGPLSDNVPSSELELDLGCPREHTTPMPMANSWNQ
jgi:hypothetical protein